MKVAIICAQGLEECEGLITYDLLTRAGIETHLLGLDDPITSSHKLTFKTNYLLKEINILDYDCLVLPGGMPGTNNLENSKEVSNAIDLFASNNKLIAAICAAPSILIHKGLLNDNEFTCYPGFESGKTRIDVKAHQYKNIITGNGLGGAFEFSYLIIKNLLGEEKAIEIFKKIQY